jgi:hypothetical protein
VEEAKQYVDLFDSTRPHELCVLAESPLAPRRELRTLVACSRESKVL